MKYFLTLLSIVCFSILAYTQNACTSAYMPFKEGVSFELTTYNKKDKVAAVNLHQVSKVVANGGDYVATISTDMKDAKGKKITSGSYDLTCKGDQIIMDVSGMLDPSILSSMSTMEIEMSGDGLSFPNELNVGDEIPSGSLDTKASMGGISIMKINMVIDNRKVVAEEKVTTAAGTFDCVKIVQTTTLKGMGNRTYTTHSWFAKGVGLVKSENIDKKGKVDSRTVLTAFEG